MNIVGPCRGESNSFDNQFERRGVVESAHLTQRSLSAYLSLAVDGRIIVKFNRTESLEAQPPRAILHFTNVWQVQYRRWIETPIDSLCPSLEFSHSEIGDSISAGSRMNTCSVTLPCPSRSRCVSRNVSRVYRPVSLQRKSDLQAASPVPIPAHKFIESS